MELDHFLRIFVAVPVGLQTRSQNFSGAFGAWGMCFVMFCARYSRRAGSCLRVLSSIPKYCTHSDRGSAAKRSSSRSPLVGGDVDGRIGALPASGSRAYGLQGVPLNTTDAMRLGGTPSPLSTKASEL